MRKLLALVNVLMFLGLMTPIVQTEVAYADVGSCLAYYGTVCTQYYNSGAVAVPTQSAVKPITTDPNCRAYYQGTCTQYYSSGSTYVSPTTSTYSYSQPSYGSYGYSSYYPYSYGSYGYSPYYTSYGYGSNYGYSSYYPYSYGSYGSYYYPSYSGYTSSYYDYPYYSYGSGYGSYGYGSSCYTTCYYY